MSTPFTPYQLTGYVAKHTDADVSKIDESHQWLFRVPVADYNSHTTVQEYTRESVVRRWLFIGIPTNTLQESPEPSFLASRLRPIRRCTPRTVTDS